jgi:UDP-glucose 4-epimerase
LNWSHQKVLVTGGASFIGSHLVERLCSLGAEVRVADDLSSGRLENLQAVRADVEVVIGDLKHKDFAARAVAGRDVVFHLAAAHGGRGYISTHPADCATNMALDNTVFSESVHADVERVCYASSACVYPTDIQEEKILLREDMVSFVTKGGAFSDSEYGWAKLMGELSLKAFHAQYGLKTSAIRIFTAYGPRENESHAIIALIAKSFIRQSPFEIWGNGQQTRNFTYVDDIVEAFVLACRHIDDGTAVNAGTDEFISLADAAEAVFREMGWRPEGGLALSPDRPVGVIHRAADTSLAHELTGWIPKHTLEDGLAATVAWYSNNKDVDNVRRNLEGLLMERGGGT